MIDEMKETEEDDLFPPAETIGKFVDDINVHVSPQPLHCKRRVRSSGARLLSPRKTLQYNNDDEQSACSYEIPHMNLASRSYDHDTHFSDFAKSRADKLLFSSSPTVAKKNVTRTFSMRLEKGLQSPSKPAYKMKKSQTLLANFTYQDENEDASVEDDEDSVVSMGSSTNSLNQPSYRLSSWENIKLEIDEKTGRIEIANRVKKDDYHQDENNTDVEEVHVTEVGKTLGLQLRYDSWGYYLSLFLTLTPF